jgi:hypothetical protein
MTAAAGEPHRVQLRIMPETVEVASTLFKDSTFDDPIREPRERIRRAILTHDQRAGNHVDPDPGEHVRVSLPFDLTKSARPQLLL